MGNFYVNICVNELASTQLEAWLGAQLFPSYVGPELNGWVCFVSEPLDAQEQTIIHDFGSVLTKDSSRLAVTVLNHDDDVLVIEIFQNGARLAAYNSCPGYFTEDATEDDWRPHLDDASAFAALKPGVTEQQIKQTLVEGEMSAFACDTHQAVVDLLGLPDYSVGEGFRYVSRGKSDISWKLVPGKPA